MTATAERVLEEIRRLPPEELREVWSAVNDLMAPAALVETPGAGESDNNPTGLPNDHPFFQSLEEIEAARHRHIRRTAPDLS